MSSLRSGPFPRSLLTPRRGTDTYTLQLPENLPPTFRGRMLKLSYQFILGVCRAASNGPSSRSGATSANSSSRVMKVPIRMYCNVAGEPGHSITRLTSRT